MSYTVFGRTDTIARSANHLSSVKALAEICRMERDGLSGVTVRSSARLMSSAEFTAWKGSDKAAACDACSRKGSTAPC